MKDEWWVPWAVPVLMFLLPILFYAQDVFWDVFPFVLVYAVGFLVGRNPKIGEPFVAFLLYLMGAVALVGGGVSVAIDRIREVPGWSGWVFAALTSVFGLGIGMVLLFMAFHTLGAFVAAVRETSRKL